MADEAPKRNLGMVDSYIRNQTTYLQGSIVQADQKATFLLAILGVLVGYFESRQPLVSRVVALLQWQGWPSVTAGISLTAMGLLVMGACCAGTVVWPRFSKMASRQSASFVSVSSEFENPEDYAKDLLNANEEEVLKRQLRSHYYRCGVCFQKWRLLKVAYVFSAAGFFLFVLHFLLAVARELSNVR
jgi:hypothetical protein